MSKHLVRVMVSQQHAVPSLYCTYVAWAPKLTQRQPKMTCTGQCHCETQQKGDTRETPGRSPSLTDDVWGSDEENILHYADLQRAHVNQGYLDGITKAQEAGLQTGFDEGFPTGGDLGIRVGKILARLHGTIPFNDAQRALMITHVLDKKYFDNQLDLLSQHQLITQWEKSAGIDNTQ